MRTLDRALFATALGASCLFAQVTVIPETHHDTSAPMQVLASTSGLSSLRAQPIGYVPSRGHAAATGPDAATQRFYNAGPYALTSTGLNFDGIGNGFVGPAGAFTIDSAPPDTEGSIGLTQYVQWVNESFVVFNKSTGTPQLGPIPGNALFAGFGGVCETTNQGDPTVRFDRLANRWVFTQFAFTTDPNGNTIAPYMQCIAVSNDSTLVASTTFNRYSYSFGSNFNDYGKIAVWPDAYYMGFNFFPDAGGFFPGGCAFNRSQMLIGAAANAECFFLTANDDFYLPSDMDGNIPPPAGTPNLFMAVNTTSENQLTQQKFHVDFATPANATVTRVDIGVAAFTLPCNNLSTAAGTVCVPQPGTTLKIDTLGDRIMYRNAYRNFGTRDSLVLTHTVQAGGGNTAVRWYEIRSPNAVPVVFQQSTFNPDSSYRFMPSIAMDSVGNILLGYTTSSSTVFPSVTITGRLRTELRNTMEAESTVFAGTGSQTTNRLTRWGDYSAMTVDPVDDCTFWYTNEYLKTDGSFNWSTRIASMKFPNCQ
jgi:hypothetical protein